MKADEQPLQGYYPLEVQAAYQHPDGFLSRLQALKEIRLEPDNLGS